jgi:hypothetical protein
VQEETLLKKDEELRVL